ncbi:MAG: cache domain-containing protein [Deltaproteobacteria bacterium]|nr:cache domain-containing protein [Deltaproteobacteria bacterium]
MFSKIYFKVLAVTLLIIAVYSGVMVFFVAPKVEERTIHLEEKTGKAHLQEVTTVVETAARELKSYRQNSLAMHREELKNITEVAFKLIEELYQSSQPEAVKEHLRIQAEAFKKTLLHYFELKRRSDSPPEIEKIIKDFVRLYRYDGGIGYFFINRGTRCILHPIKPELEGRDLIDLKDADGKYFIREFAEIAAGKGEGFTSYKWPNPASGKVEEKLTSVFYFAPCDWIIGTGFYLPEVQRQKQQEAMQYIAKLRYGDNEYFFISDYDSVLISHPFIEGKDMSEVRDPAGVLIVPPMVSVAREKGEGFHCYSWRKLTDEEQLFDKLTFSKHIEPWHWVISTGIYLDRIEREVERKKIELVKNLRKLLSSTKIGETGYIYIFDSKGNMIIHPNSNIEGKNFAQLENPGKKSFILNDMIEAYRSGSKVLYYSWDKPADKGHYIYKKVSWIDYNKDFDWYICSSAYIEEINLAANQIRDYIWFISLALLVLTLLLSGYFFKKLLRPIETLSRKALQVKEGNLRVRSDIRATDEIGTLALTFDGMLDTLEENINTLDKKVSERTRDLEEQKEVFETLFYDTVDAVIIIKQGRVVDCNASAVKMLRCKDRQELLDSHPARFSPQVQPDGQASYAKANQLMAVCLEHGANKFEWLHTRADGNNFWAEVTLTRIRLQGENLIHVVLRDISEARKIKDELLEAKDRAEAATRSKSEFLANMSHEIRTPMNGVLGMTHLVLQTDLDGRQRNFLQKIESSSYSLLAIINDILDFSKIEAGKLAIEKIDFDLFEVIDTVIGLVEFKTHEKNIELIVSYGAELGRNFHGDPLRISQVLTNLIGNAVKFTERGEIGLYVNQAGENRVHFAVRDTGIGMSELMQKKLFRSFSQADGSTSRKYGGTGLGLAISKQLVELMGGTIEVASREGAGSTFTFEIELIPVVKAEKSISAFCGKRVLIVEDNLTWQEVLESLLRSFGVEVVIADSGREALALLDRCRRPFDLILMDWNMPGLDGIETTRLIKRQCSSDRVPPTVIMVSAFRQESIVNLAKEVGIEIFLQKPVNPSVLHDVLAGIFSGGGKVLPLKLGTKQRSLQDELAVLRGKTILLAEDNSTNQEIVLGLLEASGIKIDVAEDGRQAVALSREKHYDLILMDLQMPHLDGYEATGFIRESDRDIPIIALTANAMAEDVENTRRAGMNEHLNKPIEVEKLYEVLLRYLGGTTAPAGSDVEVEAKLAAPARRRFSAERCQVIDVQKGLSHLAGDEGLYVRILRSFVEEFKGVKIDFADYDLAARTIHTLKGLSANIGALALHRVCLELEEHPEASRLPYLYAQLELVFSDIERSLMAADEGVKPSAEVISAALFAEKIAALKPALARRRSRECSPIIEELRKYRLDPEQDKLLTALEKMVMARDFKAAAGLLAGE